MKVVKTYPANRENSTGRFFGISNRIQGRQVGTGNADGYVSTGQGIIGFNMFAYCLNNPIGLVDSTGMRAVDICIVQHLGDGGSFIEDFMPQVDDEEEGILIGYSEHKKKGTVTPSNRNKHQRGQSRKNRDNGGEKGDARRKPNPNKRRNSAINVEQSTIDEGVVAQIVDRIVNVGGAIALVFVTGSYITNVGVSSNAAVAPASTFFWFTPIKMDGISDERQSVR